MIAERDLSNENECIPSSIEKGVTVLCILDCLIKTTYFFKKAIAQPDIVKPLNENKLTQIFVEQLDVQLRKKSVSFGVKNQYSDIFFKTKGIPDFYFHFLEEGKTSKPFFIVEAKRLPAYEKINEKEYVIGHNKNGGMERFKIEKHGKGQSECGMLGFIETENSNYWLTKINGWLEELSKSDESWAKDEALIEIESQMAYTYLNSIVHIKTKRDLKLHHFWIK